MTPEKPDIAVNLLDLAIRSNRDATDAAAQCFVELASRVEILCEQLEREVAAMGDGPMRVAKLMQTQSIRNLIFRQIEGMQIHDITEQRLTHVLRYMQGDASDVKETLTEGAERRLADLLEQGVAADQAIEQANTNCDTGTVELF